MRASEQAARETEAARAVRLALARHQLRREQGIPTLGVLIGTAAQAEAVWREWAQAAGWRVAVREAGDGREEDAPGVAVLHVWRTLEDLAGGEAGGPGRPGSGLAQTVERLCRELDAAGAEAGKRPVALTVAPEAAARFLGDAPFDRARAFFAEGSVVLPREDEADPGGDPGLAQSAPSLARRTLGAATVAGFAVAQASLRRVEAGLADAEETDRARSAAERFLADLLDDLPETRGLFALNAPLEFCFGPKRAEVDLLAAGLRLAVEIDGFYHFRDPDGYRRDRRKDALLQRQGYLVLRFLAEDVVGRLEEILEEIRVAVAFRRATQA